ncbi:MAG: aspartate--tRNA ligase [Prevotella sp.]|nr:aspartate--tRNA ligase [Prevotella sp.]MBR6494316.1 aspartate--tRNA ligase [Prevotella sp.]
MYRTNTCGELRLSDAGRQVTLAGWVQRVRKMGGMTFVDLRDRYGITQLVFDESKDAALCENANKLGREWCVQVVGTVSERQSKNPKMPTGDIEILADRLNVLSESDTPPFTIEDQTDGGDELRMKYRYLDLRRACVRKNLELRHKMTILTRNYLDSHDFIEVETPILIGSTPEGARDFVVPSRMNPGQFYALPQSPQTLKQLLMVSGFDRYFQIAKCFRDEDLRADRQPEFTQIDCEMSFADQEDVLEIFEGLVRYIFKETRGVELPAKLQQMTWHEAMRRFGSDKPDLRFGMEFVELMDVLKGTGSFPVFNEAEYIGGICAKGCANYTRKQLDELTDFVKRPQVGAKGLVYVKFNEDGTVKSSIDKFYEPEVWQKLKTAMGAEDGDLVLILSGDKANKTRTQLCTLRLEMGDRLGLRDKNTFECLWIVDFPLFEWSDEEQRLMATHHPFTLPNPDDIPLLDTAPEKVRAVAYDFVCNGVELGGGSLRIHEGKLQEKMFEILGFTPEKAMAQFGFLINAFKYGAPPHAGLAFGLDRFVSLVAGLDSIRDCIAFPKNNSGRDVMLDAPSFIDQAQLDELQIQLDLHSDDEA